MARYDLHFQSLPVEQQRNTTRIFTLGYEQSLGVRGFQMLINMWLRIFFTRQGSDPTNLGRGTPFANLIGSTTSLVDAEDIARTSIAMCNEQIRSIQEKDQTLEERERFATAELVRYTNDPTAPGFEMWVEILNASGERLQVNIPDYAYRS